MNKVAETRRIQIIEGSRSHTKQIEYYSQGITKTLKSKHLESPSEAVDVAPLNHEGEIEWRNTKLFYEFGEFVMQKAKELNIKIRWGGDWDGDGDYKDQSFNDLVHFETLV